jgi:hypothetical protein
LRRAVRISKGPDVGDLVDSVESVEAFAREHGLSRYDVDENSLDPFLGSQDAASACDHAIHCQDGSVVMEPHPRLAR